MSVMVGRRDFLRGKMTAEAVIRPPRAIPEEEFLDRCDGCGDCVEACPQDILDLADDAPHIDFSLGDGACVFCDDCTEACPTGALDADSARPWSWKAEIIFPDCLSYRGITCRACADTCEPSAIRFKPMTGGKEAILLDSDTCTGCGACISVCPVSAVRLVDPAEAMMEAVR